MKKITICGSLRFTKEMLQATEILELNNWCCVIQCTYNVKNAERTEKESILFEKIHKEKIDIADAIYVMNVGGYIGEQTEKYIEYAKNAGKEIIYHEPIENNK